MVEKVASNEPTFASDEPELTEGVDRGYGQNGFNGPSSDNPGKRTTSGFLPGLGEPINDQLRKVSSDPYPAAFGMKKQGK